MSTQATGANGPMQSRLEALRNRVQLMFLVGGVELPEIREHLDELHDLQAAMERLTLPTLGSDTVPS